MPAKTKSHFKIRQHVKENSLVPISPFNGKIAKPASEVLVGDVIDISSPFGKTIKAKILEIRMVSTIKDAQDMYELLSE